MHFCEDQNPPRRSWGRQSIVNVAAVPRLDDKHLELPVFDPANHAVMAGAVSPQLVQIGENAPPSFWSHFPHLLEGSIGELIIPVHV